MNIDNIIDFTYMLYGIIDLINAIFDMLYNIGNYLNGTSELPINIGDVV